MADAGGSRVTCAVCGATADAPVPLTWSTSRDRSGLRVVCDACTRQHLRSMEAQLDEEHW